MVMSEIVHQGDILKIERIKLPVIVVSKDFFNQTGEIIGCPIYESGEDGALRIHIEGDVLQGYVHCEKLALLDLSVRGYSKLCSISINDIINITDAVQGLFDYV